MVMGLPLWFSRLFVSILVEKQCYISVIIMR